MKEIMFTEYISFLKNEKKLSSGAVVRYEKETLLYLLWCMRNTIEPLHVTSKEIQLYIDELAEIGFNRHQQSQISSSLDIFYTWLAKDRFSKDHSFMHKTSSKITKHYLHYESKGVAT